MEEKPILSKHRNFALWFTLPLAGLLALVSLAGMLRPELYGKETADWISQAAAQDTVDFFLILPVLVVSGLFVHRRERLAEPIWGGALLYLLYTFIIYCFAVHFNALFLFYVSILGITAFSFIYFTRRQVRQPCIQTLSSKRPARAISYYFMAIAVMFYLLWISDTLPAILEGTVPPTLVATGLMTNPVHVLDLAFFLPGVFIVGYLLHQQHPLGLLFTPVVLVFFVLMDITIFVIFVAQQTTGAPTNIPGLLLMPAMALLSLGALIWFLKSGES